MSQPSVVKIWVSPSTGEGTTSVDRAEAEADKGIVGDRYFLGKGYYSGDEVWDANVTFIEQEAFDAANADSDEELPTDCLRRNIVTQGVDLKTLLGKNFRIGSAVFQGWKIWPPCKYIDSLNPNRDVLKKFGKSAGIGANVLQSGDFAVGDAIEIVSES